MKRDYLKLKKQEVANVVEADESDYSECDVLAVTSDNIEHCLDLLGVSKC